MRHGKKINHLGRTSAHRKAMLANMASSLIMHKKINTTLAKAKALRVYVEPLITKSKEDSTNSRRVVFSYLQDKVAVTELFREIATKIAQRPGGYTRILKTGNRLGDNAEMCLIELVDYNENLLGTKQDKKSAKSTTRRKSTAKKKVETTPKAEKVKTVVDKETEPKEKAVKVKAEKKPKTEESSEIESSEPVE
jgi:large subunit ribosomal protein L17